MEVRVINVYGEDPFVSTGKKKKRKIMSKQVSIDIVICGF